MTPTTNYGLGFSRVEAGMSLSGQHVLKGVKYHLLLHSFLLQDFSSFYLNQFRFSMIKLKGQL